MPGYLSRSIGNYIPGNPDRHRAVNMPGAASLQSVEYLDTTGR